MGTLCSPDLGVGVQAGRDLERCQQQADEVTEIMLDNFNKVLERDGKLAELEQRSDQLLDMCSTFNKTTETLAKKKKGENTRCHIYLGLAVGGVLLVVLIVLLVIFLPKNGVNSKAAQASAPGD
ncbi:vesicle-associated membrane protein 5 [Rhynchocyon petersi]